MRFSAPWLAFTLCTAVACIGVEAVHAQPTAPYAVTYGSCDGCAYDDRRAQREARRAEKQARREQRQAERALFEQATAEHRAQHRVFTYVGVSPLMIVRQRDPEDRLYRRFRQRTVTLGLGYRREFGYRVGVHVSSQLGMGRTVIVLSDESAPGIFAGDVDIEQTPMSFSYDTDLGLTLGPFRHVYVQPSLDLRFLRVPGARRLLAVERYGADDVREAEVHFRRTQALIGGRLGLGVLVGDRDQVDIAIAGDVGRVVNSGDRYYGLVTRVGVALQDLFAD